MTDERHNDLNAFTLAHQARIRKLCLRKHLESRRLPCVKNGLACFECQDEVGVR